MFSHRLTDDAELRLLQQYHAEEVFALIDRNREHLRRWLPWVDNTRSAEDTHAFRRVCLRQMAETGSLESGIWYRGQLAGIIWLGVNPGNQSADISYWLGEEFQGNGLMTLACRAVIDHAFGNLDLHRIEIRVEPENTRSRAIPLRLGFQHEGTLRQFGRVYDRRADLEVYALLREEWEASRQTSGESF